MNMLRPKLIAAAPAGTAGVCQFAWLKLLDPANHGLDVQ